MEFPPKLSYCHTSWRDAHSPGATEVFNLDTINSIHGSMTILTSGWLLKEDKEGVTIASEYCGDKDFRGVTHVPAEMIIEIVKVKPSRPRKKKPVEMTKDPQTPN